MGTAAYGGKGFKRRAAVSGDRPIGAAAADNNTPTCHANTAPPPLILLREP